MNCETLPLVMNAALDGELSSEERADMHQHLADCSSCREQWTELQGLHHELTRALQTPSVQPAIDRVLRTIRPVPVVNQPTRSRASQNSLFALVAVACALVMAVAVLQWPTTTPAIAEIAMATGPVDFKPFDSLEWIASDGVSPVILPAHTRVRTRSESLCEIRTRSDAVVRLNHETELIVHKAEKVELVTGELWCRAPTSASLEICGATPQNQTSNTMVFTCPSMTEMQWKALPDQQLSCMDVAATPAEIQLPKASCTIQPGECLTFVAGQPQPEQTRRANTLQATTWQLPLLARRNPADAELRDRLTQMLSFVGQTKASYMYEDQIRQLGPPGVLPLMAYVKSDDSRQQPQLRHRAMDLISEMATTASVADLEELLRDPDPLVQKLSLRALRRLQPERKVHEL